MTASDDTHSEADNIALSMTDGLLGDGPWYIAYPRAAVLFAAMVVHLTALLVWDWLTGLVGGGDGE